MTSFDASSWSSRSVDNGEGTTEAMLEQAFTAFFTTKPRGMGLGLSISRSIAEAQGGTLLARSTPGEGGAFRLELPRIAL